MNRMRVRLAVILATIATIVMTSLGTAQAHGSAQAKNTSTNSGFVLQVRAHNAYGSIFYFNIPAGQWHWSYNGEHMLRFRMDPGWCADVVSNGTRYRVYANPYDPWASTMYGTMYVQLHWPC